MSTLLFTPVTDDIDTLMIGGPVEIVQEVKGSPMGRAFLVRSVATGDTTLGYADELTVYPH